MIKEWFEQTSKICNIYKDGDSLFVIYKGFKLIHHQEEDSYDIIDVRFSDYYTSVKEKDLDLFKEKGFVKGADLLVKERAEERMERYLRSIGKLYEKREEYEKKFESNPKFYTKKINNANINIHRLADLYHFYKAKSL